MYICPGALPNGLSSPVPTLVWYHTSGEARIRAGSTFDILVTNEWLGRRALMLVSVSKQREAKPERRLLIQRGPANLKLHLLETQCAIAVAVSLATRLEQRSNCFSLR